MGWILTWLVVLMLCLASLVSETEVADYFGDLCESYHSETNVEELANRHACGASISSAYRVVLRYRRSSHF